MGSAGNFNPQWGYVAPAGNFMRTMRVALVAMAVGASAGAGAVVSLVDHPSDEQSSVAARTLARGADNGSPPASEKPAVAVPVTPATSTAAPSVAARDAQDAPGKSPPEGQSNTAGPSAPIRLSKIDVPPSVAEPAAAKPATDAPPPTGAQPMASDPPAAAGAAAAPAPKKSASRKHHSVSRFASRGDMGPGYGPDERYAFDGGRGYYRDQRWGGFFPGGSYGYR